jgi:putative GTP pyrophosphokinase
VERQRSLASNDDPGVPKYNDPLRQITDLAGVRIIAFFPKTLANVEAMVAEEFAIVERSDKGELLVEEERFGYQSIHYLVKLSDERTRLPEYQRFRDAVVEIQVRTILQHAWAEIEHDIQYKSASVIPAGIRRRFMALAGLLDLADREFQAIQNEDVRLTEEARTSVEEGNLDVEITPSALKTYLDRKLGVDGRIAPFSYEWTARILKSLGFRTLDQVEKCIERYDDDRISQIAEGYRQGQTRRFEHVLLAGMGRRFIERHPLSGEPWFISRRTEMLEQFTRLGVPIGDFDPLLIVDKN